MAISVLQRKRNLISSTRKAVRATGTFGETMVTSGTSMAVPHVVDCVSLLWLERYSKSKILSKIC